MLIPILSRCRWTAALAALFAILPSLCVAEDRSVSFFFSPPIFPWLPPGGSWSELENWKPEVCMKYGGASGTACVQKGYPGIGQPADAEQPVFYYVSFSNNIPFMTATLEMNVMAGNIAQVTANTNFEINGALGLQRFKVPVDTLTPKWLGATFENNSDTKLSGRLYSNGGLRIVGYGVLSLMGGTIEADYLSIGSRVRGAGTIRPIGSDVKDTYTFISLVDADIAGVPLSIYLPGTQPSKSYNVGRLEASDGGTLRLIGTNGRTLTSDDRSVLQSMVLQDIGGVIRALDGSTVELSGQLEVRDGRFATIGSGRIEAKDRLWLYSVTNDGLIHAGSGARIRLSGQNRNNGLLQLDGAFDASQIELSGDPSDIVELVGNGVLELNHPTRTQLISYGPSLINGAEHTIRGTGRITPRALYNFGLIDANGAEPLKLAWNAAGQLKNTGGLVARNGGVLDITGATWTTPVMIDNTGGAVMAFDGSLVQLTNVNLTGGTFAGFDGGTIRLPASGSTLGSLEIFGTLDIRAGTALGGTVANHGRILLGSGSAGAGLSMLPGAVLAGDGVLSLSNSSGNRLSAAYNGGSVINGPDHTIEGAGRIGDYAVAVVNQGLIVANQSNRLELVHSGSPGAEITNDGTLRAARGSTLLVNGNLANFDPGTRVLNGGRYEVQGTMRLPVAGGIAANASAIVLDGPGSALYAGAAGAVDALAGFTTNGESGRFEIRGGRNFTTADFLNAGEIAIGDASTFTANNYGQIAGVTTVDGTLQVLGNLTVVGGRVEGSGTILGGLVNAGWIAPGNSPGVLSIAGDFTQTTGVLAMELGALAADRLVVDGTATLGGTLEVSLWTAPDEPAFVPTPGQQFDLVLAALITGDFDRIELPQIAGLAWGLDRLSDANAGMDVLRLTVKPVPLPPALPLAGGALAATAAVTRRQRRAHC